MEAVIFHKKMELNIPDELESKCLAACEIMEKEESMMKPQFDINDMKSEDRFPLIALSAVAGQMESSNTVKEQELNDEMHALSIKLPSFSDISEIIAYKMKATPYYEQFLMCYWTSSKISDVTAMQSMTSCSEYLLSPGAEAFGHDMNVRSQHT